MVETDQLIGHLHNQILQLLEEPIAGMIACILSLLPASQFHGQSELCRSEHIGCATAGIYVVL